MDQTEPEKLTRFVIHIPADMAEAVDEYWHANRLRSRAEAGRQLLAFALEHVPEPRSQHVRRK